MICILKIKVDDIFTSPLLPVSEVEGITWSVAYIMVLDCGAVQYS